VKGPSCTYSLEMDRWVSAADTRFESPSQVRALAQHHDPNIAHPRFPKCNVLNEVWRWERARRIGRDAWMAAWTDGCMDGCMDGRMNGCMHGRTDEWMAAWTDG
jgi:hypothetical protein